MARVGLHVGGLLFKGMNLKRIVRFMLHVVFYLKVIALFWLVGVLSEEFQYYLIHLADSIIYTGSRIKIIRVNELGSLTRFQSKNE